MKETLLWKKSPTRVIRFWSYRLGAGKTSWAVPLCLLCSDTFPQAAAAWLDLGWFHKRGMFHALGVTGSWCQVLGNLLLLQLTALQVHFVVGLFM